MTTPRISIFFILITFYGRYSHKLANNYVNETLRNTNIRETLTFNKRCKKHSIVPRSLMQRPPLQTPLGHKIAKQNALRYLDAFIQDGYRRLRISNHNLEQLRSQLQNSIPDYLLNFLDDTVNNRKVKYRLNLKTRLQEKFNNLSKFNNNNVTYPDNWIMNLSSHTLTEAEKSVLNKGLNYSIPNTKNSIPKFIATIENSLENLRNVSENDKTIIRHQVNSAINATPKNFFNISQDEAKAIKELRNNNDIVIAPADKGRAVVIMNKVDYNNKIEDHLSDQTTYVAQARDTTNSLRTSINQFLKQLLDMKLLSKIQYHNLFANSALIPLFYALIKIHKIGNPIRPIVSFIGSPSYKIAKFISKLLTPFTNKSPIKLQNSVDIKQKLQNVIIPATNILISFDVKALFTSIPQNFAIDCLKTFLEENQAIFEQTRLNTSEILKLVRLCFDATLFSFNVKFYRQVTVTPMGSPFSVVIAEIVIQVIETNSSCHSLKTLHYVGTATWTRSSHASKKKILKMS